MTVMTEEWAHELKVGPKRRLKKVKDALGIKPNQGYRVRYLGTFMMTDQKVYYVYKVFNNVDNGVIYRYAFLDLNTEEFRNPTNDEAIMMTNNQIPMIFID